MREYPDYITLKSDNRRTTINKSILANIAKAIHPIAILVMLMAAGMAAASEAANSSNEEASPYTGTPIEKLCKVFSGIREATAESGGVLSSKSDWDRRIAWTEQILAAAPPDFVDEAEIYLQLVKDRAALVAEHGYIDNRSLPQDARNEFIAEHKDEQLVSNRLIEFATSSCGLK